MLDHRQSTIQTRHRGDRHWGHGRSGPDQRWLALYVDGYGLSTWSEVHSGADGVVPPVAMEAVVG